MSRTPSTNSTVSTRRKSPSTQPNSDVAYSVKTSPPTQQKSNPKILTRTNSVNIQPTAMSIPRSCLRLFKSSRKIQSAFTSPKRLPADRLLRPKRKLLARPLKNEKPILRPKKLLGKLNLHARQLLALCVILQF